MAVLSWVGKGMNKLVSYSLLAEWKVTYAGEWQKRGVLDLK